MGNFSKAMYEVIKMQNPDDAEKYLELQKEYDRLAKQDKILERLQYLTPGSFVEQMRDALKVKRGYYKNKRGEYIHMCGIEVYGNTGDLCRMGYNGEDRGVFPHWVFMDATSIKRIDSPIIGFTKWFSIACVGEEGLMHPTTKEDFEEAVQRVVKAAQEPWQDPDNISEEDFLKWMEDWIAYVKADEQLTKKYLLAPIVESAT